MCVRTHHTGTQMEQQVKFMISKTVRALPNTFNIYSNQDSGDCVECLEDSLCALRPLAVSEGLSLG